MYEVGENCQVERLSDIYVSYFGENKCDGHFVEIGAYDGYQHSNVWGLIKKGWKGLEVEPNVISFNNLVRQMSGNGNVICANVAIGKQERCKLYLSNAISTTSEEQAQLYRKCHWFYGGEPILEIDMMPLDYLLEQLNFPTGFEVLVVDVEGTELEVLQTFSINKWNPKMCIIEAHEHHPEPGFNRQAPAINQYFENAGYEKIYCDMINNIYVRKDG